MVAKRSNEGTLRTEDFMVQLMDIRYIQYCMLEISKTNEAMRTYRRHRHSSLYPLILI
jgi:hypothetical protein